MIDKLITALSQEAGMSFQLSVISYYRTYTFTYQLSVITGLTHSLISYYRKILV